MYNRIERNTEKAGIMTAGVHTGNRAGAFAGFAARFLAVPCFAVYKG